MARILVVDDEADERDRVSAVLVAAHHDVITAEDGIEAVSKLQLRPELVILDLVTPGMTATTC